LRFRLGTKNWSGKAPSGRISSFSIEQEKAQHRM
jgi:hypothetical protein